MISVIIGLYNEEEVLPSFIKAFFKTIDLNESYELILVDDGSTDNTKSLVLEFKEIYPKIKLISYSPNKGLGNALRIGFRHASGRIIITMDSDLAHPPRYISKMAGLVDQGYDVVIGSRYVKGGGITEVPVQRDLLSRLTNYVTRLVVLSKLKDLTCGFRAYNSKKLRRICIREKGFEVEVEILVKFMRQKSHIKEMPFISVDRQKGESKFNIFKDGLSYIIGLFKVFLYRWF